MKNKKNVKPAWGSMKYWVKKFKPQHDETMLSLQYCKPIRQQSDNAEEWKSYLRIKANECKYKEIDRGPKEQFINGINNREMMTEIIW